MGSSAAAGTRSTSLHKNLGRIDNAIQRSMRRACGPDNIVIYEIIDVYLVWPDLQSERRPRPASAVLQRFSSPTGSPS